MNVLFTFLVFIIDPFFSFVDFLEIRPTSSLKIIFPYKSINTIVINGCRIHFVSYVFLHLISFQLGADFSGTKVTNIIWKGDNCDLDQVHVYGAPGRRSTLTRRLPESDKPPPTLTSDPVTQSNIFATVYLSSDKKGQWSFFWENCFPCCGAKYYWHLSDRLI